MTEIPRDDVVIDGNTIEAVAKELPAVHHSLLNQLRLLVAVVLARMWESK